MIPRTEAKAACVMVNDKGNAIKDNWIGLRAKKVAEQLTIEYGLKQAVGKSPSLTHTEQLKERDRNRLIVYETISGVLPNCISVDDLIKQLQNRGIETLYKYKAQTEELQGISFLKGEYKYKGSEIDRQFSLKNLERTLQKQSMKQQMEKRSLELHVSKSLNPSADDRKDIGHQNALDLLLKAEKHPDQLPNHWKITNEKKRKRRGLHL